VVQPQPLTAVANPAMIDTFVVDRVQGLLRQAAETVHNADTIAKPSAPNIHRRAGKAPC
jgi:hypothetical protein